MASINKQSVRDEFDKIKASFDEQVKSGKVPAETATLVNALFMLFGLIMSIFMEKITKKTSDNSSIPPSQTEPDDTAVGKGKKNIDKTANETITTVGNTRTVETVEILEVSACDNCGHDLGNIKCECVERRTRIDIVFEKTVEHVDAEIKKCPGCKELTKATFPKDMSGPLQYGNGIKAYVVQLLVAQMVSLSRTVQMVSSIIGQVISEATLLGYVMRLYVALAKWEENAKSQLLMAKCIHTDETSLRVDKKNQWIHVYSAGDITLKLLHRRRGKEAVEEFGIIPLYGGVIVHDCWASYLSYKHLEHGLCGSHLLRELQFMIDANGYRCAKNLRRLLQKACKMVSKSEAKCLNEATYLKLARLYREIMVSGYKDLPEVPKKTDGKRGKIAKSDAHNLWERLDEYQNAVLLFAKNPHVAFTNNRAERDLRMTKVKQKVSGCFRTEKYAKAYCRISSYLQTMNNKGINPLVAVSWALSGKFDV
jgi:transposase